MNPSLSDRLKSLGVIVGAQQISPAKSGDQYPIESVLGGEYSQTQMGDAFIVEKQYPSDELHGHDYLRSTPAIHAISNWAKDTRILSSSPNEFAYIDTETTGLAGGTGTYAFLIGAGLFKQDTFHLFQLFMKDPSEEPAMLVALEQLLAPIKVLVTFNGKSFDFPLLNTRFIAQGWKSPLANLPHIDLLHLSRKLWKDRLPSRTLGNLEVQILGAERTVEDVPGWMIPEIYFEYLRTRDARPLKNVFYHNAMDVLSMVGLLNHTAILLAAPLDLDNDYSNDTLALAKFFEDIGDETLAENLYLNGLNLDFSEDIKLEALVRLAKIYKKRKAYHHAIQLWEKACSSSHIESHIELAKYYEHKVRDHSKAVQWTISAITRVKTMNISAYERRRQLDDLEYRLARLQRKIERHSSIQDNS